MAESPEAREALGCLAWALVAWIVPVIVVATFWAMRWLVVHWP